jgi:two-component system, OmpR family, sensor histidine kinase KdpD
MQKFFKKGNLLALRELSLKYTAKRVDIDLLSYREREEIHNVWPIESKLLVGISSNKITEKILLTAHRMATDLEAEWYAVHVDSPQQVRRSEKARAQLYRNIHLAEELGARVVTLSGNNIADELIQFARQKNITLVITGLSQRSRFQEIFKGSVLNKLIRESSPANVLVVGDESPAAQVSLQSYMTTKTELKPYILTFISVVLLAIFGGLLSSWMAPYNLLLLMLLPTVASGILWGTRVGFFAAILSIAIADFFFIPPPYTFAVNDMKFIGSFAIFIFVSTALSWLGRIIRWKAETARYRERFIYALYQFSHEMMIAENLNEILTRAVRSISEAFDSDIIFLLPDAKGTLELTSKSKEDLALNEMEKAVATWVYKNGRPAGKGTSTLSSAKWHYLPLSLKDKVLGVVCLMKLDMAKTFTPEQRRLLESFAGIISLALEKSDTTVKPLK